MLCKIEPDYLYESFLLIINFTEINQHANEKKFENEYFKDVIKKKGIQLVDESTHKHTNDDTFSRAEKD